MSKASKTSRRTRRGLGAAALVASLLPAAALVAVASAPGLALAAPPKAAVTANCNVHVVHASKVEAESRIPADLEHLSDQLGSDDFLAYKSFKLMKLQALGVAIGGGAADMKFQTGNRLSLKLLGADKDRLELHATLSSRDGKKSLLSTDYSIVDNGVFMIGAGRYQHEGNDGRVIVAIQCAKSG